MNVNSKRSTGILYSLAQIVEVAAIAGLILLNERGILFCIAGAAAILFLLLFVVAFVIKMRFFRIFGVLSNIAIVGAILCARVIGDSALRPVLTAIVAAVALVCAVVGCFSIRKPADENADTPVARGAPESSNQNAPASPGSGNENTQSKDSAPFVVDDTDR